MSLKMFNKLMLNAEMLLILLSTLFLNILIFSYNVLASERQVEFIRNQDEAVRNMFFNYLTFAFSILL